jgi:hypothetical protein
MIEARVRIRCKVCDAELELWAPTLVICRQTPKGLDLAAQLGGPVDSVLPEGWRLEVVHEALIRPGQKKPTGGARIVCPAHPAEAGS